MTSLVERLSSAFVELTKGNNLTLLKIDQLEESWSLLKLENISFDKPMYQLEESRKGFRLRRIDSAGTSQLAIVNDLDKNQAWLERHTLEYG